MESVQAALQSDTLNPALQDQLGTIGDRLSHWKKLKAEGQRVRSRVKWKRVGDLGSKEFLRASKAHSGASNLTKLEDEEGNPHTDQAGLEEVCSKYYGKLYKEPGRTAAQEDAATWALGCLRDRLTDAMKQSLRRPISIGELGTALKAMSAGKAPGLDGVVTEFFKIYSDLIKEDYFAMVHHAIATLQLPPGVNQGLISLIHKGDLRTRLTN